jgi:hypothetical protein
MIEIINQTNKPKNRKIIKDIIIEAIIQKLKKLRLQKYKNYFNMFKFYFILR